MLRMHHAEAPDPPQHPFVAQACAVRVEGATPSERAPGVVARARVLRARRTDR